MPHPAPSSGGGCAPEEDPTPCDFERSDASCKKKKQRKAAASSLDASGEYESSGRHYALALASEGPWSLGISAFGGLGKDESGF